MIYPKDDKLSVADRSNQDEDQHVYIPFETKVKQNAGMIQRCENNLKLIIEIAGGCGV